VERELAPQLWVDKHKPMSMAHLVGNTDKVRSMLTWLKNWGQNNSGETKSKGGGGGYGGGGYGGGYGGGNNRDDGGVGKKAVLITGPPGVGKSSAARIVAEEAGYDVIELNASDEVRNACHFMCNSRTLLAQHCRRRSCTHRIAFPHGSQHLDTAQYPVLVPRRSHHFIP
jgi:hypothetical protein